MKSKTTISCEECKGTSRPYITENPNAFGYHLKKSHPGMSLEEYEIKWVYGGIHPKCKMCGSTLLRPKGGFRNFCSKKCSSAGEHNPMYGKKGDKSPNAGKVRTAEHRERYRQAAYKRFEKNPNLIEQVRSRTIERVLNGTFKKTGLVQKIDPISGVEESYDSKWEADSVRWLVEEKGYFDLTKQHDIRISYVFSKDNKEHVYLPDFLSEARKTIIEVRGRFDKTKGIERLLAGKKWCLENDYEYKIITKMSSGIKGSFVEVDIIPSGSSLLIGPVPSEVDYGSTTPLLWNGRSLSKHYVEFLSVAKREELSKAVLKYYKQNGFPYPQHDKISLADEWNKLKYEVKSKDIVNRGKDGKVVS